MPPGQGAAGSGSDGVDQGSRIPLPRLGDPNRPPGMAEAVATEMLRDRDRGRDRAAVQKQRETQRMLATLVGLTATAMNQSATLSAIGLSRDVVPDAPEITDPRPEKARRPWQPSPAIARINPRGDASAARVVARHAALAVADGHAAHLDEATRLVSALCAPLVEARRHSRVEFGALRRRASSFHEAGAGIITARQWDDGRRPSFDPSYAGCSVRVDTSRLQEDGLGLAGVVQLRCTTTQIRRSSATMGWYPLPVSWRQHAAERALQRGFEGKTSDIHASIGTELIRLMHAISVMADATHAIVPGGQLAVPFGDGLLMGAIDLAIPGIASTNDITCLGTDQTRYVSETHDVRWIRGRVLGLTGKRTWTAMTFLDASLLTPAQRNYADAFRAATASWTVRDTASIENGMTEYVTKTFKLLIEAMQGPLSPRRDVKDKPGPHPSQIGTTDENSIDLDALRQLARDAHSKGVAPPIDHGQRVAALVPIRGRDHDVDPIRRALAGTNVRPASAG